MALPAVPVIRRDHVYWQRLRRDRRSNVAAGLAAVAALAGTLSLIAALIPAPQAAARGNPAYWLLMLPMAWWVTGLSTFEARYVQRWGLAMAVACLAGVAGVAAAWWRGSDPLPSAIGLAVTIAAAVASLAIRRGSLVAREGPAR